VYRSIYKLGFIAYALLLIMALLFYKERIIFMDTTLFTFNILRKGSFSIEHYRFIAVFTEMLPLLVSKIGASLKGVICYLLCGLVFRKYHYALGILLINTILVTDIFYWPISELPLGLALLLTIMAFLEGKTIKHLNPLHFLLLAVFVFTLAFAHPLMMFPASFGLLFLFFSTKERSQRIMIVITGALFLISVGIKHVYFKEEYDSGSMASIANFKYLFPDYFHMESNRTLFWAFFTKYYWLPVCAIIIAASYILSKNWLKLALFLVYLGGYTLLVNVCYHYADMSSFYMENLYQPLAVILAVPLLVDVLPVVKRPQLSYALIALIVFSGFFRIFLAKQTYNSRLAWYRQYLNTNLHEKQMIHASKLPMEKVVMAWPSPYEFWVLSTIEKDTSASIVFYDTEDPAWARHERKSMVTTWGAFPYDQLNPRYFKFSDTSNEYRLIK
jgi:hypothetical protein